MEGENVPQDNVVRVELILHDSTPDVRVSRFIHAVETLGVARHVRAVWAARTLAWMP